MNVMNYFNFYRPYSLAITIGSTSFLISNKSILRRYGRLDSYPLTRLAVSIEWGFNKGVFNWFWCPDSYPPTSFGVSICGEGLLSGLFPKCHNNYIRR